MQLEQRRQAMPQLHLSDQQFYCQLRCHLYKMFKANSIRHLWKNFFISFHRVVLLACPSSTVYPKKYAHGLCFAVLCCGYTLTDLPISIRLTSLALWQSNDCPSASKATLVNMDKYFIWIHYERLHNHNKAKHNKTVCILLGIYCMSLYLPTSISHGKKTCVNLTINSRWYC